MPRRDENRLTVRLLTPGALVLCLALFSVGTSHSFLLSVDSKAQTHPEVYLSKASHNDDKTEARMLSQQTEKRELENRVPKHVPLEINLRPEKEAAFRKLDNERWVRDLELDVKNTGDKPIYFFQFVLEMPDMTPAADRHTAFFMHYGRDKLILFETPLTSEDVLIKPGETVVLKVDKMDAEAWEHLWQGANGLLPWQLPKKVILLFERLNFGDGTGFDGGDARPWPQAKQRSLVSLPRFRHDKMMLNGSCEPGSRHTELTET